jgi:hypothetical protein
LKLHGRSALQWQMTNDRRGELSKCIGLDFRHIF